jgi:predicted RND superfamily exporter protein
LIVAICLGGGAWMLKGKARFDYSIEGMFTADDTRLLDYQRLKQIFGGVEIVMVVYDDPELFAADGAGLRRLEVRSQELARVRDVIGVLSLSEFNQALKKAHPLASLLGDKNYYPILDANDPIATGFLGSFENYTHGHDRRTVAIVCLLEQTEAAVRSRNEVIHELRELSRDWPASQVTGEPVLVDDGFRFLRRDARQLDRRCLGLMGLVILVCFRSVRWFLIPVAIIQFSMWMTLATMGIIGWRLTMVSSMLSAILAVISVATVVHIIVRYREARIDRSHDRETALVKTLASMMLPVTWTCLTTAAGFLALTIAKVEPIVDFGWMMVVGTMHVWLNVFLLIPSLAMAGEIDADPQATWGEGCLEKILGASSWLIVGNPVKTGLAVLAVFLGLGAGLTRLQVESDFTKNFRQDSTIIQAYTFVEQRLGGAGILDVVIRVPDNFNREFLEKIDALQNDLRHLRLPDDANEPALTHVVSFADADRIMRSNPLLALLTPAFRFHAMEKVMPGFSAQMRTTRPDAAGHQYFRIMLRTRQQKSAEVQLELIEGIREIVQAAFPDEAGEKTPRTMTSGFFVLLSSLVDSVLADQNRTFAAACVFIGLVILLAFRSWTMVIIALLPNVLPIIGLLGMLGWLGIRLNMGAAMIAAVSLGLSIDGTIHYLTSWRVYRAHGLTTAESIQRVQFRTGRAVSYATLALVIGFGSLCYSEFIPTVFFGGLVSLSMLGGLLANLIVLPVLLSLFFRREPIGRKKPPQRLRRSPELAEDPNWGESEL